MDVIPCLPILFLQKEYNGAIIICLDIGVIQLQRLAILTYRLIILTL